MRKFAGIALCMFGSAFFSSHVFGQLSINGGTFIIDSGAVVSVQGDVISDVSINGSGKILLNGTVSQTLNMNGNTVPALEIDNAQNIALSSAVRVGKTISFLNGKLNAGNFNVTLAAGTTVTGAGNGKYIDITGTGEAIQELDANISDKLIPVGVNAVYRPAFVTTSATAYSNGKVGVRVVDSIHPNKPNRISSYLETYWPITRSGITGTVSVKGQYADPDDVIGMENKIRGYFYNGTEWSSIAHSKDWTNNQIGGPITGATGALYGMGKFIYVGPRACLQGAYNASSGLMNENLRTPTLRLPNSDPYRLTAYSSNFVHVNNSGIENVTGTPFAAQSNTGDNIVDWVFLELRNTNASPGNTVLQTRSALIQRDGDIVDVDGVSPVLFNDVEDGNYAITVRHRNHFSMSLKPTSGAVAMNETKGDAYGARVVDLRQLASAQLYGDTTAYTRANHPTLGSIKVLWGGNANANANARYAGAGNDRAIILSDLSNNELGVLNGYSRSDLNMNGAVRYAGANNDRSFLLSSVLESNELKVRNEQRPN
jgi:hypothetical protein